MLASSIQVGSRQSPPSAAQCAAASEREGAGAAIEVQAICVIGSTIDEVLTKKSSAVRPNGGIGQSATDGSPAESATVIRYVCPTNVDHTSVTPIVNACSPGDCGVPCSVPSAIERPAGRRPSTLHEYGGSPPRT